MDGVVECDASIVDHHGRSGAVGAVARKYFLQSTSKRSLTSHCVQRSGIPFLWLVWFSTIPCKH
jgi:hypothetical protein